MQVNNNVTFTSVIPVKVIANGQEVTDPRTIRNVCNRTINLLSGPLRNEPNSAIKNAAARLSTMDPDYNFRRAYSPGYNYNGFLTSDWFKAINHNSREYIVIGPSVLKFKPIGQEIGSARKECNNMKLGRTNRLDNILNTYYSSIHRIANNISMRVKELYNTTTGQKLGEHQQMEIYATLKNIKRNGQNKTQVVSIDNINFSKFEEFTKS